jgi:cytochrome oxidase Cu insertion factor (SCO1/SenC/PrrC family)
MIPLSVLVLAALLAMTRVPAAPATSPVATVRAPGAPQEATDPAARPTADGADGPTADGADRPTADGADRPTADGADRPTADGADRPTADGADEPTADGTRGPSARLGRGLSRRLPIALGTASASVVVALWAGGMLALGAAPMALAEASRTADPIIATALNGSAETLNFRAAGFSLTDQYGRPVSLGDLHGKVVLLTFLDPVCTSDCPLIAQEFRQADQVLGARASHVELVAIVANPLYRSVDYTQAFDRQELLTGLPNWLFLTGSLPQLTHAWKGYYVTAQLNGPGAMALHPDIAYVINADGVARTELNMDPGPGSASSESSFAVELADAAEHAMDTS